MVAKPAIEGIKGLFFIYSGEVKEVCNQSDWYNSPVGNGFQVLSPAK